MVVTADSIVILKDLDVNGQSHWAKDFIEKLVQKGIIAGYPDGTFKPNNNVEVDAYIKMVVSALGNSYENGKDYWASPYIEKALKEKLIDDGEFDTYRRPITREEAAKIIVQALGTIEELPMEDEIKRYKPKVPDYTNINQKYRNHALTAYATGMITGDPKGNFMPTKNLSRAEAAVIIMRLLDKSLRKPILTNDEVTAAIPELLKTDEQVWGREDIPLLTSSYRYSIKDGNITFSEPGKYENYTLDDSLNPDISKQVYQATKVLIDDNHYVDTLYANFDKTRVFVGLSKSLAYANNSSYFFLYRFYEKEAYNAKADWRNDAFSDKVYITLDLYKLWRVADENSWSIPYYETKLKHSLIAIFGEVEGAQIYDYVYGMYIDKRNNPDKYKNKSFTKKFTTVQVDFPNDTSGVLHFNFSRVGDN